METTRKKGGGRGGAAVKTAAKRPQAKGSGARGRRGAAGRGRGRGRGRGAATRVVMAWNSEDEEDDADEDEDGAFVAVQVEEMTESDYERLDEEIDGVVETAALEAFAGTMVVDADDVAFQRETIADAAATSQKNKTAKQRKKEAAVGAAGAAQQEVAAAPKKRNKKPKKDRVSVVVTEGEVLEIVQLENEMGVMESGQTVAISVKGNKKKKPKNKKATKHTEELPDLDVEYESVEIQEVAELVEDMSLTGVKKQKKKSKQAKEAKEEMVPSSTVDAKGAKKAKKDKKKSLDHTHIDVVEPADGGTEKKNKKKKGTSAVSAPAVATPGKQLSEKKEKATAQGASDEAVVASTKRDKKSHTKPELEGKAAHTRENYYEDYSDRATVMAAIERGELYQGKIRINPQYRLRAFITVDGIRIDILIDGTRDRNRAMDGDLVAIKLLDEDKWKPLKDASKESDKAEGKLLLEQHGPLPSGDVEEAKAADRKVALNALWRPTLEASRCFLPERKPTGSGDASSKRPTVHSALSVAERSQQLQSRPTAKVVFIIAPGNAQGFVGSLEPKSKITDVSASLPPNDDYAYFNAQDQRLPRRIRIPRLQLPDAFVKSPLTYSHQMMCFCRITKWSASHESPVGEFVKTLGEYSGIESGISAILMKHGLMQHTNDFRHEILAELDDKYGTAGEKWTIPDDEIAKRRDFRQHQIFSIDPYNARDLDDALHIRALNAEETLFEVGVHIADVTHFIDKGCLLDVEAQQRATSVYLANRVLPMLPRILCERLCSLQPQVDRLAFSVVWQMHSDGSLVEDCVPWFGKSIIRSCCKLDYGTAQRMLDGAVTPDNLDEWEPERRPVEGDNAEITPTSVIQAVQYLWKVAKNRRATRFDTGAVTLQDIKLTFNLDAMGNPTAYGTYQIKDSNRLVEEYMLLANYLVAQKLLQAQGPLAFIRRHPEPNETALENTLATLSENTIEIDGSSPRKLTDSLSNVRELRGDYVYGVVQNMITKPMKPAEYLVAGNAGHEDAWRHYALNIPYYTHFTSPIRRYADVVVHRLLQESIVDPETVAARVEEAGDDLTAQMDELQSVAQNCNEKKMTAKNAERECDQIFLCAFVKHNSTVDTTGVVVSTGSRSFTVYISELGLEQRIEVKDLGAVRWSWQEKTSTLSLEFNSTKSKRNRNKAKTAESQDNKTEDASSVPVETTVASVASPAAAAERVELKFLTKLRMRMTTTDRMPLALKFEVVGPWKEE